MVARFLGTAALVMLGLSVMPFAYAANDCASHREALAPTHGTAHRPALTIRPVMDTAPLLMTSPSLA
jgi:hypothetical protein